MVENVASSEGGQQPRTDDQRSKQAAPGKMENELEMKKATKVSTDSADQVAGRKGKGMGMLDKLVPGKT